MDRGYPVSYNASILNGLICDRTARTYEYMRNFSNETQSKTKHILTKYFYNDGSIESNLFFVLPLHPYLQLFTVGELWHVRSKIFYNSLIKRFAQIYDTFGENNDKFPDYLMSGTINQK